MVLVQGNGDLGVYLRRGLHEMVQKAVVGVLARASRSLDDDGRPRLPRGLHDRLYLLQVVDVERPYAVAPLRRFVQKLAHRNQCHVSYPPTRSTKTRHRNRSGQYRRFCAPYQRKSTPPGGVLRECAWET